MLHSYLQDTWVRPDPGAGPSSEVHDAVTGELTCRVSSAGLDPAAALRHAHQVGGPTLRSLTFHERAALLDTVAVAVRERRSDLYGLSVRAGAALRDARYDVDGGIRVLRYYARSGPARPARRALPGGGSGRAARQEPGLPRHASVDPGTGADARRP